MSYTREKLESMTVDDLREVFQKRKVAYRDDDGRLFRKGELISIILKQDGVVEEDPVDDNANQDDSQDDSEIAESSAENNPEDQNKPEAASAPIEPVSQPFEHMMAVSVHHRVEEKPPIEVPESESGYYRVTKAGRYNNKGIGLSLMKVGDLVHQDTHPIEDLVAQGIPLEPCDAPGQIRNIYGDIAHEYVIQNAEKPSQDISAREVSYVEFPDGRRVYGMSSDEELSEVARKKKEDEDRAFVEKMTMENGNGFMRRIEGIEEKQRQDAKQKEKS